MTLATANLIFAILGLIAFLSAIACYGIGEELAKAWSGRTSRHTRARRLRTLARARR